MADRLHPKPGDLLEYRCPTFGIVWQWRVHGVFLGAERQEGLIEVSPVMARPGSVASMQDTFFVPEPMTRTLTIFRKENQTNG